jgi:hypothetical protein
MGIVVVLNIYTHWLEGPNRDAIWELLRGPKSRGRLALNFVNGVLKEHQTMTLMHGYRVPPEGSKWAEGEKMQRVDEQSANCSGVHCASGTFAQTTNVGTSLSLKAI